MTARLLQLSDLHLLREPDGRIYDVPIRATLGEVLRHIDVHEGQPDLLVITGDLADDGEIETYRGLRAFLGDRLARCRVVPGNQDQRENLRRAFPDLVPAGAGPLTFTAAVGDWRAIGLDSNVAGHEEGRLSDRQLEWLRSELGAHPDAPTLLFVHHPPLAVTPDGEADLEDPGALVDLVNASPQVKAVCCGHVHYEFQGTLDHATVYTTPSTALQYHPTSSDGFDHLPPGYRRLNLGPGTFETEVVRLPTLEYPPSRKRKTANGEAAKH